MKYLLIATALAFITCCKKTDSLDAELAKLPPITQTGANTFGCLVNGKAYIPSGYDGSVPNFDVLVDLSDSSVDVLTYTYSFSNTKSGIVFGSSGCYQNSVKNFQNKGKTLLGLYGLNSCYIPINDSCYRVGKMTITRYDVANKIFAGEFNCKIIHNSCSDTVFITNGRFDKKIQ